MMANRTPSHADGGNLLSEPDTRSSVDYLFHHARKQINAMSEGGVCRCAPRRGVEALAVVAVINGKPEVFAAPDVEVEVVLHALRLGADALEERRRDGEYWKWPTEETGQTA